MKIEVGDREKALAIFRHLEPTPLLHTADVDFKDAEVYDFLEQIVDQLESVVEWKVVPNLPWTNWEVNRKGEIRHRQSKTMLEPKFDMDLCRYIVIVGDTERRYYIDGVGVASEMNWEESEDAGTKDS